MNYYCRTDIDEVRVIFFSRGTDRQTVSQTRFRHTKNFNRRLKIKSQLSIAICIPGRRGCIMVLRQPSKFCTVSTFLRVNSLLFSQASLLFVCYDSQLLFRTWSSLGEQVIWDIDQNVMLKKVNHNRVSRIQFERNGRGGHMPEIIFNLMLMCINQIGIYFPTKVAQIYIISPDFKFYHS